MNTLNDFSWELLFIQIFIFGIFAFWIYCMIDLLRHDFQGNVKSKWVFILLFLPFLGCLLYITFGMDKKIKRQ